GRVFNWQTATYGKIRFDDGLYVLRSVEAEFPAIIIDDTVTPQDALPCKSQYTDEDIADFEERLERIYGREIHRVQVVDFQGILELMRDGLFTRMRMEHRDDAGVVVFTSRAWGRLFDTRGPLVRGLILEFLSMLRFGESKRMIPGKGDLQDYRRDILTDGDFLGPPPSYTLIRDLVLRLCHQMMAYSIAGRSQAPEKVTVTDLFYLRGLDVGLFNIPYVLARYLRRFAARRKSMAHIFGGQFVARLAKHFRLLTVKILGGLMVISPELPIIDMAELPNAAAGAHAVAEDAPAIDEGDLAVPAPVQCGGGGVGCGGTAAGEEGRVRESGSGDRVDPLMGIIFGLRRKNPAGKVFRRRRYSGRRWGGVAGEEGGEGEVFGQITKMFVRNVITTSIRFRVRVENTVDLDDRSYK
ncbi:hypothetical protein Tco_1294467, partial [Tanacetum coccineum]